MSLTVLHSLPCFLCECKHVVLAVLALGPLKGRSWPMGASSSAITPSRRIQHYPETRTAGLSRHNLQKCATGRAKRAVTLSILYRPQLAPLLDSPNYASTKQQEKGLVVSIMTEMIVQCSRAYPVIPALYLTRPFSSPSPSS